MTLLKYILIPFVIFSLTFNLMAKDPEFRVLGKKGKVLLQSSSNKQWVEINTGSAVNKNDKISLKEDSYLGLVHYSGKTIEITKPGTYSISALSKELSTNSTSSSQKFANYVIDEITAGEIMIPKTTKNLSTAGSVERATGGDVNVGENITSMTGTSSKYSSVINSAAGLFSSNSKSYIKAILPRNSYIVEPEVTFSWYKNQNVKKYTFNLMDRKDNSIYKVQTSDTALVLNLQNLKIETSKNYYWYVTGNNDEKSDQYCIYLMNESEIKDVNDELESIVGNKNQENAITKLILASFYEDENIMNLAIKSYREALVIAPDVPSYKNLYAQYLYRIGLQEEAKRILK